MARPGEFGYVCVNTRIRTPDARSTSAICFSIPRRCLSDSIRATSISGVDSPGVLGNNSGLFTPSGLFAAARCGADVAPTAMDATLMPERSVARLERDGGNMIPTASSPDCAPLGRASSTDRPSEVGAMTHSGSMRLGTASRTAAAISPCGVDRPIKQSLQRHYDNHNGQHSSTCWPSAQRANGVARVLATQPSTHPD
eukprot:CAMPEP_0117522784 /NCGR_PEP_ID=MMETSP0784-20121206/34387_1 /TAXON_ID=39447 /ORGANISM="" /LENGTH=197 /DNA_ID=CAMNT_0005318869 /DNA_START=395 /DNA_END=984 /DNA_ORIENTATION=+